MVTVPNAELLDQLRSRRENVAVLDAIQKADAHSDLAAVLHIHARKAGAMRVNYVADADYPALFATVRGSDTIVVAAAGMQRLMIRSGGRPGHSKLGSEPAPDLGDGWWRVDPFDADVTIADTTAELDNWFALATVIGAPDHDTSAAS